MTTTTDLAEWIALRAWVEPAVSPPGGGSRLVVEATVPDGGHIEAHEPPEPFLIPTILEVATGAGVEVGAVAYPPAEERRLDWSPTVLQVLAGTIRFEAPLEVRSLASDEPRGITATLSYQGCIDGACLPPNVQSVDVTIPARA